MSTSSPSGGQGRGRGGAVAVVGDGLVDQPGDRVRLEDGVEAAAADQLTDLRLEDRASSRHDNPPVSDTSDSGNKYESP